MLINWCWCRRRDRAATCQKTLFIYFPIGLSWASQSISLLSLLFCEVIKGVLIYWQPTVTFSLPLLFSNWFHFQVPWEEKFSLRRSRKPHFCYNSKHNPPWQRASGPLQNQSQTTTGVCCISVSKYARPFPASGSSIKPFFPGEFLWHAGWSPKWIQDLLHKPKCQGWAQKSRVTQL